MTQPKQRRWLPLLIFLGATFTFSVTMIGTTMPTPPYPIWQDSFGFSDSATHTLRECSPWFCVTRFLAPDCITIRSF